MQSYKKVWKKGVQTQTQVWKPDLFVPFPHYMIIFSLLCINIFFKASWLVVGKKNKNMSVDFLMKIF